MFEGWNVSVVAIGLAQGMILRDGSDFNKSIQSASLSNVPSSLHLGRRSFPYRSLEKVHIPKSLLTILRCISAP